MARDRAIQLSVELAQSPPTLRLYQWTRPTVTLGRFQKVHDVDLEYAAAAGIDVVRRFTGGRGVLHDDELTYSVVARTRDGIPRGVADSYRYLSGALACAYAKMGISASVTERDSKPSHSGACYLANTRADLSLGSMKLAGSAQVWHGDTVLQHGSFTISRDSEREGRLFRLSNEQLVALQTKTASLVELTGESTTPEAIAGPVVEAFRETLGVDFLLGSCSTQELELAETLLPQVQVNG